MTEKKRAVTTIISPKVQIMKTFLIDYFLVIPTKIDYIASIFIESSIFFEWAFN